MPQTNRRRPAGNGTPSTSPHQCIDTTEPTRCRSCNRRLRSDASIDRGFGWRCALVESGARRAS
ncbi:DUF6011 domain-containing protein [Mycobacterium sp. BMJ-28]